MKKYLYLVLFLSTFFSYSQNTSQKDTLFNGKISFKDWEDAKFLLSIHTLDDKIIALQIEGFAGKDTINKIFKVKEFSKKNDTRISLSEDTDELIKVKIKKGFSSSGGSIVLDIKMRNRNPKETIIVSQKSIGNYVAYLDSVSNENEIKNIFIRLKAGWWLFWIRTEYYIITFNSESKISKKVIDKK